MSSSMLDSDHIWFVKIGGINERLSKRHVEHKAFGNQRPPELKGQLRKVDKLMRRDVGNLVTKVLLSETNDHCATLIEQRRRNSARREDETVRNNQEKEALDNSASDVLGLPKVDGCSVPDFKPKTLMNHFKIPCNNTVTLNNVLSELIATHFDRNDGMKDNSNSSKTIDVISP